jgi:hypothetical protein
MKSGLGVSSQAARQEVACLFLWVRGWRQYTWHVRGSGAIMCEVVSGWQCFCEVDKEAKVKRKKGKKRLIGGPCISATSS